MNDDATLLRRYAEEGSEADFTQLVHRHVDLVYGAALRRTSGDAHRAADVAQQVFTQMARRARQLSGHTVLSAWLHTATRNTAIKFMLSDQRRKAREVEALALTLGDEPSPDWERLQPLLDSAVDELSEANRAAIVLRFFERRSFADIGSVLRVSEDAARMRVERALEKLRTAFARRGVRSTSAALAAVFANQVGATAPTGLATSIASTALAGAAASGLAVTGIGILMSTKSTIIASAVALAAISSTLYQWNHAQRIEAKFAALTLDRDSLHTQLGVEQQRAARSARDLAALQREVEALTPKQMTQPASAAAAPTSPTPVDRSQRASALSPDEVRVVALIPAAKIAMDAYRAANHGEAPPNPEALIPYFATPQEGADFAEFIEAQKPADRK